MPESKPTNAAPKPKNAIANYFSETIAELKKVTWLSRRDLVYLSGIVLLVVVNHEQPDDQQSRQDAADNPHRYRQDGKSSRRSRGQQKRRRTNDPPAFPEMIPRIRLGAGMERFTRFNIHC